ncbi:hypothetical protein [Ensifer sp. 4252]|uniref:hypothetical protein n=1 Tax=Ensifer sp. 4252 TaxID=3373915 RepID=UPI003D1D6469
MIAGPKNIGSPTEREFECRFAMREEFEVLTYLAERAGWRWDEIALALLELTDEFASAQRCDLALTSRPPSCIAVAKTRH